MALTATEFVKPLWAFLFASGPAFASVGPCP